MVCALLLTVILLIWRVEGEGNRVPLRVLGLFPYKSDGFHAEYVIPAARLARDEINNNTDILPGYKLELIEADSGCSRDQGVREFVRNALHADPARAPVAILGAGCSSSSLLIASVAGRDEIRIPQLSYSATSPILSFRLSYPYFYRTVPTDSSRTAAIIGLMKKFNWKRYGIHNAGIGGINQIVTEHAITSLRFEAERHIQGSSEVYYGESRVMKPGDNVTLFTENVLTENVFTSGVRVVLLYGAQSNVAELFCLLYRHKLTYPRVVWMVANYIANHITKYEQSWYNTNNNTNCTLEEIHRATHGVIQFDYQLNSSSLSDLISVTNKTFSDYYQDYLNEVKKYANEIGDNSPAPNDWATVTYDSMWSLGLALDEAEKELKNLSNLSLRNYTIGNKAISLKILEKLDAVAFDGASGRIAFDSEHKRDLNIAIFRVRNGDLIKIGTYVPSSKNLTLNETALLWSVDNPPSDDFTTQTVLASLWAGILMLILLIFGFVWNSFSLVVNFRYQHFHSIKASSPQLNYMMFAGNNILLLAGVVIIVKSMAEHSMVAFSTLCRTRSWLFDLGLLLLLNTTLLKSWRIYRIFFHTFSHKHSKLITDNSFIIMTIVWIIVHTLYHLVYLLTDDQNVVMEEILPLEDQLRERIIYCPVWDLWGLFYVPHFLIAVMLCVLAFLIRRVKHKQFNDATNIAIFFYTTTPVAMICGMLSFVLSPANGSYHLSTMSLILECITIFCIVFMCQLTLFVPKMLPLFRQWRTRCCNR